MSISVIAVNSEGLHLFKGLSSDTKGTGSLTLADGTTVSYEVGSVFTETDSGDKSEYRGAAGWVNTDTSGAAHVAPAHIAGERHDDSTTTDYLVVRPEHNGTVLSAGTSAKALEQSAPCHLCGILITTQLVGTLTIAGFFDETGAAATLVLPVGFVAGYYSFDDTRIEGILTLTKSSASDDGHIFTTTRPI